MLFWKTRTNTSPTTRTSRTINATGQAPAGGRKGSLGSIVRSSNNASQLSLEGGPMPSNGLPTETSSHIIISRPAASSEVLEATPASNVAASITQVPPRQLKESERLRAYPPGSSDNIRRGERSDEGNTNPGLIANPDTQKLLPKAPEPGAFGVIRSSNRDSSTEAPAGREIASQVSSTGHAKSGGSSRQDVVSRRVDTGSSFVAIATSNGHPVAERLPAPKMAGPTDKSMATQGPAGKEIAYQAVETHSSPGSDGDFLRDAMSRGTGTGSSSTVISGTNRSQGTERPAVSLASTAEKSFATQAPVRTLVVDEEADNNKSHSVTTSAMISEERQTVTEAPETNSPSTIPEALKGAHEYNDVQDTGSIRTGAKNDHAPMAGSTSQPLVAQELPTQAEESKSAHISNRSPGEYAPETITKDVEKRLDEQDGSSESDNGWYGKAKIGFRKLLKTPKVQVPPDLSAPKRNWADLIRREARDLRTEDIKEDDTVIVLMGPTGVGKSSFISTAVGSDRGVGHGLESCTSEISVVRVRVPDEDIEVVLVDTPGFDDTHKSDFEILKLISDWLKKTYEKEILLSGILYLHRISDNRMAGTPLKNLEMFRKLCGRDAFSNTIMVTTMWGELDSAEIGYSREHELKTTFWKPMLQRGSTTIRYDSTAESAWSILEHFLDAQRQHHVTRLQNEMVNLKKSLNKTEAGHKLRDKTNDLLKTQDTLIRALKKQMEKSAGDDEIMAALKEQHSRLENEREEVLRDYQFLGGSEGRGWIRPKFGN